MDKKIRKEKVDEEEIPFFLYEDLSHIQALTPDIKKYPYLVKFRALEVEFRIPELESLANLFKIPIQYDKEQARLVTCRDSTFQSPFLCINATSDADVARLGTRSIGIRTFWKIIATGTTYEELISKVNDYPFEEFYDGVPFKFVVDSFGRSYNQQQTIEIISNFKHLALWDKCPVSLKNAQRIFGIIEDIGRQSESSDPIKRIWFCVLIKESPSELIEKFNLKKRQYIGTTSMESELSLLVANQALAREGTLVYDPFAGTGSLLVTCAEFGSLTIGADIDSRPLKGNDSGINPLSNFVQYGFKHMLVDLVVCDHAHPTWRMAPIFDAIVCDPPYGIREGARKVGKKKKTIEKEKLNTKSQKYTKPHTIQCIAYPVPDILKDLLEFAAKTLVIGGRLVYWFPTTHLYKESDLPLHPCLRLVSNSQQILTRRLRRRLITMEKHLAYDNELVASAKPEEFGQLNIPVQNIAAYIMNRPIKEQPS